MNAADGTVWPLPKFFFRAGFGDGTSMPFQEVSGMDGGAPDIEYRQTEAAQVDGITMPPIRKAGNVTLKKGIASKDAEFIRWCSQAGMMNPIHPRTVVIQLLDQADAPTMTWTLNNAWVTKLTGLDLNSDGDQLVVESVELAFETIVTSDS